MTAGGRHQVLILKVQRSKGEVHYFDPVDKHIEDLKAQTNVNSVSYFNKFGLGDENKEIYYYPKYQSFYDRIQSCGTSDDANKILLSIKKSYNYVVDNNIHNIDFLRPVNFKTGTKGARFRPVGILDR